MNQAIFDLFQLELPQLEARLTRLQAAIAPPDEDARAACKARWDAVGKPLGSLGLLETDTQKIAALTGSAELDLSAHYKEIVQTRTERAVLPDAESVPFLTVDAAAATGR